MTTRRTFVLSAIPLTTAQFGTAGSAFSQPARLGESDAVATSLGYGRPVERVLMEILTIYYDGHCPLCQAEIRFLQSRNHAGLLRFVGLQDPHFSESAQRFSCAQALATIHGRLGSGELLTGVRVFAEAYRRVGLNVIACLLSVEWLQPAFNAAYRKFARHRHALSRCIGPLLLTLAKRFCKAGNGAT